jgi:beta-carotene 15,15'-dioxygenase
MMQPFTNPFAKRLAAAMGLLFAALGLLWLDRVVPSAAGALLLVLSATLGIGHGATDVLLMRAAWRAGRQALWANLVYALTVALGVVVLLPYPAYALLLLLLLSVWHFGEGFERFTGLSPMQSLLTRLVFGGAPVLLPAMLAQEQLGVALRHIFVDGATVSLVLSFWVTLAAAWLVLVGVFAYALFTLERAPRTRMYPWLYELGALVVLYAVFSPMMAAAVFFGVYHSGQHLRRVLASALAGAQSSRALLSNRVLQFTMALSLMLGVTIFMALVPQGAPLALSARALQTWVVFLTAVSVPHVFLISYATKHLFTRAALEQR